MQVYYYHHYKHYSSPLNKAVRADCQNFNHLPQTNPADCLAAIPPAERSAFDSSSRAAVGTMCRKSATVAAWS